VALGLLLNAKDYDLPEFCVEWAEHQRAQVFMFWIRAFVLLCLCRAHLMKLY
jgi:hypothetical protein